MSKGKGHDCDAAHPGKTHYKWLQDSNMSHNSLGEIFSRPDKKKNKVQFAKDNKEKGEVGTWKEKKRRSTKTKSSKKSYNHGGRHQHD